MGIKAFSMRIFTLTLASAAALSGCRVSSTEVAPASELTSAETPNFGKFSGNTRYPATCGQVYELNIAGSGCDANYRVIRASYTYNGQACTDLLVTSRNASCRDSTLKELPGQVVRKCADGSVAQIGSPQNLLNLLTGNAARVLEARSACQGQLRQVSAEFQRFDAVYRAYEERLNNLGRDLVANTLKSFMRQILSDSQFSDRLKGIIQTAFDGLVDQASEGGELDLAKLAGNQLKSDVTGEIKAGILAQFSMPEPLAELLASMILEESITQATNAAADQDVSTARRVLTGIADKGSDMVIGAVSSVADKFGLGGVLQTELTLLKSQVNVLLAAIPLFAANGEATRVCNDYVSLFNTSIGSAGSRQILQCIDAARDDSSQIRDVFASWGI